MQQHEHDESRAAPNDEPRAEPQGKHDGDVNSAANVEPQRLWTNRQRTALLALLCIMLGYLLIRYLRNPAYVSDPQPLQSIRADELADRIDPNVADVDTLGALPTLGEKRAKLIVDYRERFHQLQPKAGPAYQRPEDLLRIRGIGAATIEQLRPFLLFPTTAPIPSAATTKPDTQSQDE